VSPGGVVDLDPNADVEADAVAPRNGLLSKIFG